MIEIVLIVLLYLCLCKEYCVGIEVWFLGWDINENKGCVKKMKCEVFVVYIKLLYNFNLKIVF